MLACARIACAVHSMIFGGFIARRAGRPKSKTLRPRTSIITADGSLRRGKRNATRRPDVDESVEKCRRSKRLGGGDAAQGRCRGAYGPRLAITVARPGIPMAQLYCAPVELDAEDPLFILYTSGSTGKPKGVLHTTGGYFLATHARTSCSTITMAISTVHRRFGWVTGHSYIVYGPLANGATTLMFEGAPNYPNRRRVLGDRRKAQGQHLYTRRPTAIRAAHGGASMPAKDVPSSLRLLGSVGEPINPEAWDWYHRNSRSKNDVRSWTPGGRPKPGGY